MHNEHCTHISEQRERKPFADGLSNACRRFRGSLSGGQKQRLLLARAVYKQPKILALDEATSHLDVQNEQKLNAAMASLQVTRIMIAHRPETINSADRVVSINNGELIELRSADALAFAA